MKIKQKKKAKRLMSDIIMFCSFLLPNFQISGLETSQLTKHGTIVWIHALIPSAKYQADKTKSSSYGKFNFWGLFCLLFFVFQKLKILV